MNKFIKETIKELEIELQFEINSKTETSTNAMAIATCKRRLETALDAEFLLDEGEISLDEAESMITEALFI